MSRYRKIHVKMWTSPDFLALSAPKPSAQTLFVYLLTGPHTTAIPGLFQAGKAQMAEALGWPQRAFDRCWSEIESRDMARADWSARLVYLPGALAHNAPRNPNEVRSWREQWALLPRGVLLSRAEAAFAAFIATMGPSFAEAWANVTGNVGANVTPNVPANVPPNVDEKSSERYPERSGDCSGDGSTRMRTHAGATPAPVPDLRSPEGVQGEPDLRAIRSAYHSALCQATATAWAGVPDYPEHDEVLAALWAEAKAHGVADLGAFRKNLADQIGDAYEAARRAGKALGFNRPGTFLTWRAKAEGGAS
jgi:hypothetical protein